METTTYEPINADPSEIANAIKRMIKDVVNVEATILSKKNHKSTVQVAVLIEDRFLMFSSDINEMIGVQSVDFNKYERKGIELQFVLLQENADKLLEKYGE